MGDIHGAYRAMLQCFERAEFNLEKDRLICLGDVSDGWPDTKSCITHLRKVKRLIYILGNHDVWTLEWMITGNPDKMWLKQGGRATVESYGEKVPKAHIRFLQKSRLYYVTRKRLFVHAGIEPDIELDEQSESTLLWDRGMGNLALKSHLNKSREKFTSYSEVYIGHTPINYNEPIQGGEIWMMDTGAGWNGVLSMMDIDSKEVFTSDPVPALYPGVKGRYAELFEK